MLEVLRGLSGPQLPGDEATQARDRAEAEREDVFPPRGPQKKLKEQDTDEATEEGSRKTDQPEETRAAPHRTRAKRDEPEDDDPQLEEREKEDAEAPEERDAERDEDREDEPVERVPYLEHAPLGTERGDHKADRPAIKE